MITKSTGFVSLFLLALSCSINVHARPILFTSWNIEWLSELEKSNDFVTQRQERDIAQMANYLQQIKPDILAFQEIDSLSAIQAVTGTEYSIYLSDRALPINHARQFDDINQYTGFAVRRDWLLSAQYQVDDPADLDMLQGTSDRLRFASYIVLTDPNSAHNNIHLLSIHLKAGCAGKQKNSKACNTLKQQGHAINQWLTERVENKQQFVIGGDFNHNLAYPDDWLYQIISNGLEKQLKLASKGSSANCLVRSRKQPDQTYQYKSLIDHLIVSEGLDSSKPKQFVYPKADLLTYQLSDHCPLTAILSR